MNKLKCSEKFLIKDLQNGHGRVTLTVFCFNLSVATEVTEEHLVTPDEGSLVFEEDPSLTNDNNL